MHKTRAISLFNCIILAISSAKTGGTALLHEKPGKDFPGRVNQRPDRLRSSTSSKQIKGWAEQDRQSLRVDVKIWQADI